MPEDDDEDGLVVYSDYVCPFCYLGKVSLERYLDQAENPPEVTWKPFDLRRHKRREDGSIDHSVEDGKDEAYYERAKAGVRRLSKEYQVEMTLDLPEDVDSRNAHLVTLLLEQQADPEKLDAFRQAVFEALWRQGRDIGDPEVLEELVAEAGLDPSIVSVALQDAELEAALDQRLTQAHRQGVTGVPTFVKGNLAIPGAVPPEQIGKLVDNA